MRYLWTLVNRPRPVDPHGMRVACSILLVFYLLVCIIRYDSQNLQLQWGRLSICLYAAIGILLAPHLGWRAFRTYVLGLAVLLPAGAAYAAIVHEMQGSELALIALATFVPLVFLPSAIDIIFAVVILSLGQALLLALFPPATMALSTAATALGGSLAAGAAAGLVLITFRAKMNESMDRLHQSWARERTLREFAELAASHLGSEGPTDGFAGRFRSAFGTGHCVIISSEPGSAVFRVAATAGLSPEQVSALTTFPLAPQLAGLWSAVASGQAIVREKLDAEERRRLSEGLPHWLFGGCLVALPITVEDVGVGAVILSAPEPRVIGQEEILLWRAMANQVGVAVATGRLFSQLQKALNAKSEFVNTMSHELRSPLNVIIGYTDILVDGGDDPGFVAERVRASALELLQLVENTMTAARLGTGKVRLQLSEFSLLDLVSELTESIRALPEANNGVPVRWEITEKLSPVRLDRLKVKEIVHNLVSNALKFTREGVVTVAIHQEGERVRIEVRDTGSGIPPESQARIFEIFERVETHNGHRPAGVGLGLYIVKGLVDLMNGHLQLISNPGQGAHFIVRLPRRLEAPRDRGQARYGGQLAPQPPATGQVA